MHNSHLAIGLNFTPSAFHLRATLSSNDISFSKEILRIKLMASSIPAMSDALGCVNFYPALAFSIARNTFTHG